MTSTVNREAFNETHATSIRMDLKRLREVGIFIRVKVDGVTKLSTSTTWDEFGIPKTDMRSQRLRKGRKTLVSQEFADQAHCLAVRVRQNLELFSYALSGFMPYRWIPVTAYATWRTRHMALEEAMRVLAQNYDYTAEIQQLTDAMRQIGYEAVISMRARGEGPSDQDVFIAHLVEKAVRELPTYETMQSLLTVSYESAFLEDTADLRSRELALETASLDQERIRAERAAVEEMHRLELERARTQIQSMASPWEEMLKGFEERIASDVVHAMETIQRQGYVPGKTATMLKGLREMYQVMSVAKNHDVEQALDRIEQSLNVPAPAPTPGNRSLAYNVEAVKEALDNMLTATHQQLTSPQQRSAGYEALELD